MTYKHLFVIVQNYKTEHEKKEANIDEHTTICFCHKVNAIFLVSTKNTRTIEGEFEMDVV